MAWENSDFPIGIDERMTWMASVLDEQRWQCNISGKPLTLENVSLERVDEEIGYVKFNVVFIRREFQSSVQWTREAFEEAGRLRHKKDFEPRYQLWKGALNTMVPGEARTRRSLEQDDLFNRLAKAVHSAKTRTVTKGWAESEITKEFLVDQYIMQGGRCHYTNVPLDVNGEWKWSKERLDNSLGYIKDNVVFVIQRVNTFEQWSRAKADEYWGPLRR